MKNVSEDNIANLVTNSMTKSNNLSLLITNNFKTPPIGVVLPLFKDVDLDDQIVLITNILTPYLNNEDIDIKKININTLCCITLYPILLS